MQFHHATLSNGLDIIAERNDAAYSVSLGFFVNTGARNETADVAGVSHFLEHMLFKGTSTRSAEDVNRRLDELGADSNAFTSEEQTVYFGTVLPELQNGLLELFADILQPSLRNDDFETERQVILEEIRMYEDQPPYGVDEKSRAFFFAEHPLANDILGSPESVGSLTVDRMRKYWTSQYRPSNMVLAASGRVDFDGLVRQAEKLCGSWTNSSPNPQYESRSKRVHGRRGFHPILKETSVQQYVLLLSDAPNAVDDDRFAAGILTNIVGDDVGSRLFWELIDTGLADAAGLGTIEFSDNGYFLTCLSGESEQTEANLNAIRRIYAQVSQNGIDAEELERSKNKILSRMVLAGERSRGRLFALGEDWAILKQYRPLQQVMDDVRRVSADDIRAVLEKYPITEPLMVSVGPLTDFKHQ